MSLESVLISLAKRVLENVLSQLNQQLQIVQEQAQAPLRMIIQKVVGGAWKGRGAEAFVEELSSLMLPNVEKVAESISTTSTNIVNARTRIEQADEAVARLVHSRLDDKFDFYR